MNSALAEPLVSGAQRPKTLSVPAGVVSSAGDEAIELAHMAGLHLDSWQQFVLSHALGERPDGKWSAFEVGLVVPRQNGKGSILEARELAGLFLLGERLIIHSAHQFDTSLEAFRRLLTLIEDTPDFARRVKRVSRSHGEEGIELKSGQRIRFRTRTKGGGRGFTGDCLILDEAMYLPEAAHGALLPTLSARPNPQVWYTGSAVDQNVHEHGLVLTRVRERGHKGDEAGLAYFEWAADAEINTIGDAANDQNAWAAANPGLGIRISLEHVAFEQRSLDARTFAVERLGIGDWPRLDSVDEGGIAVADWLACLDPQSELEDPVCLAFDVKPDRSGASIAAAGVRADGLHHVEIVERRSGTGWVAERLAELMQTHRPVAVICDGGSPAASLLTAIAKHEVDVRTIGPREHAQACGLIFDEIQQHTLRHRGSEAIVAAIKGAARRPLGDAWAWSRKSSTVDISPLVAGTLALWGFSTGSASWDGPLLEVFG